MAPARAASPLEDWSLCGPQQGLGRPSPVGDQKVGAGTYFIEADQAEIDLDPEGTATLLGDVRARLGRRQIQGDTMVYDRPSEQLDVLGTVRYWDRETFLSGARAHFDLELGDGWVDEASFRFLDRHGRGTADKVTVGGGILLAEQAKYTTCNPGATDWEIGASSLRLDKEADTGTARNVTVRFKDVPIFYSPWLSFPLSRKRKSGFLAPSYGSTEEVGADLLVPFYWNIAPERDATLALRAMSTRGTMFQGEYRYLMATGLGNLNVEYLPSDRQQGDSRSLYRFQHQQRFSPRLNLFVDLSHVSDRDYFEDLGTNIAISSTRFLDRRAELRYQGTGWSLLGRLQSYQTVDRNIGENGRPFDRLPQLLLTTSSPPRNRALSYGLRTELVRFDHDARTDGWRYDLTPNVSYPMRTLGTFLIPRLEMRYTHYALKDTAANQSNSQNRSVPTASLDGGLFLERDFAIGKGRYTHTIEPRLFYLYVPFRNQDNIPTFDTSEYTFSFAQLFRTNRFTGSDRVGDANQLTVALTTRLIDQDSGLERLRLSVGEIRYFRDRRVTLPGRAIDTESTSDIVVETAARIAREWSIQATAQWDTGENTTNRGTFTLRYRPNARGIVNVGYRFIRNQVEQTDLSARWPVNRQLSLVGRWSHEVPENRILDAFGGIEYNSCCWAVRAVLRKYLNSDKSDHVTGIYFQLLLKGLGGIGGKTDEFLRTQIPGYRNDF